MGRRGLSRRASQLTRDAGITALAFDLFEGSFKAGGVGLSVLLAFAGGAVLASLADTLMPDAYREGGGLIAFSTVAGFFLSFMIDHA